jgi:hypothetical protein
MVDLNENGKKVEASLNKAGFTLREACMSIQDMIGLGLVDSTPPLTGDEFNSMLAAKTISHSESSWPEHP